MSLLLALALASTANTVANCAWDHPGVNPFTGDPVAAIDHYTDMEPAVRAALKARIAKRQSDDIITIRRDNVAGKYAYDPEIRGMHFGAATVCATVSRSAWTPRKVERALVYCEQDQCVIVPAICGNVSRITRRPELAAAPDAVMVPRKLLPVLPVTPEDMAALMNPEAPKDDDVDLDSAVAAQQPRAPNNQLLTTADNDGAPLAPVPEPGTWTMLAAGLAAVGFAAVRRR
jgi:hypothetical protein